MSEFWSDIVHQLDPYVPGEQPKQDHLVKLNTNENPYPPSPQVFAAIKAAATDTLRLYPDPESDELRQVIAGYFDVAAANVFVGNGSDEVLAHTFNTFFKGKSPILFPDIGYSFYPVYCGLYEVEYRAVPLDEAFRIVPSDYDAINGGIIFANPNAPTGIGLAEQDLIAVLEANRNTLVVVDEAYIDFSVSQQAEAPAARIASAIPLIKQYNNLLVIQTLSKSRSLAGLRLGYALGDSELINGLNRVKNSFNSYPIDRLAQQAAIASFQDEDYFSSICERLIAAREEVVGHLVGLGFECLPSSANFIFVRHQKIQARVLAAELRKKNIIVRYFDKPRISHFLRITIGSDKDNQALLAAVQSLVE